MPPRLTLAASLLGAAALAAAPAAASAPPPPLAADASVTLSEPSGGGGRIPSQFVGLSVEWSLIERYMAPSARPAFASLLQNLGSGVLRIGGSSQDLMEFQPGQPNTLRNITPDDLQAIRATLDRTNGERPGPDGRPADWGVILGTTLAPPNEERPWAGAAHAKAFTEQGVAPAFSGRARRYVTSIGLGNEPDLSYGRNLQRYLTDFTAYQQAGVTRPFALDVPSTSEPISPWQSIRDKVGDTRFFHDWPTILDAIGPATRTIRAPHGAATTDHFYPTARGCDTDPYRCSTIPTLLDDTRAQNFDYVVHTHAEQANQRGLSYRLGELNTAAGRGQQGVSDVAASATWTLDTLFRAACPQPPDRPGANADCKTGAIGVNIHNSEVRAFWAPEEGNAYYNAVNFDPSPAIGAPTARPAYYALLLFSKYAQDSAGLRPAAVRTSAPGAAALKAWRTGRRLFLINKGTEPVRTSVGLPGGAFQLSRMTPHDPTGAGRTLDAPEVRIDGRSVAADGRWPGFAPETGRTKRGEARVTVAPGEAVVLEPGRRY